MGPMAFQTTSLTVVYSAVYSGADQRKHQSSASLAFVRGIHRGPVNSPHKWPVKRNMFPFHDVIMWKEGSSARVIPQLFQLVYPKRDKSLWRHIMETFSASLELCAGIPRCPMDSTHKGLAMRSFDVSFVASMNKSFNKLWHVPVWRHCNG